MSQSVILDEKAVKRLTSYLEGMPKDAPKAVARAMNRAIMSTGTAAAKIITQKYTLKSKDVKQTVLIKKAKPDMKLFAKIREVSKQYFSEKAAVYHYYGTAMSTWAGYLKEDTVRYKKYFYALRPLLAARYIERFHAVPPVLFDDLMKMDMEPELRSAINDLLEKKKTTTEGEHHPHIPIIRDFIREELQRQKAICDSLPEDRNKDLTALNRCFAEMIDFTV